VSSEELRALLLEAAAHNGMAESPSGYLRPIISRGAGPLGVSWSDRLGPARLNIIPQRSERAGAFTGAIHVLDAAVTRQRRADPHAVDPRVKRRRRHPCRAPELGIAFGSLVVGEVGPDALAEETRGRWG
jgi:hypothetical protein